MAQLSSKKLPLTVEQEIQGTFYQVLADLEDEAEAKEFAAAFFSESELSIFSKRLAIAYFLSKKHHYEEITQALSVSTSTVSAIAERLPMPGFRLAIHKISLQTWARRLSSKLLRVFKTLE